MPPFLHDLLIDVVLTTPLVGAYILFALGVVFIFRASRVLNLAHGAMAMFPAFVAYALASSVGVVPAVIGATLVGGLLGVTVERVVVRRLRPSGPTAQTVGTVAVFGLLVAVAARIWGTTPLKAPSIFPEHSYHMGSGVVSSAAVAGAT